MSHLKGGPDPFDRPRQGRVPESVAAVSGVTEQPVIPHI
jgi:hypothetical protein